MSWGGPPFDARILVTAIDRPSRLHLFAHANLLLIRAIRSGCCEQRSGSRKTAEASVAACLGERRQWHSALCP